MRIIHKFITGKCTSLETNYNTFGNTLIIIEIYQHILTISLDLLIKCTSVITAAN